MTMGLVGQKLGMTRIFGEDGSACAVTVIEVKPIVISQLKGWQDILPSRTLKLALLLKNSELLLKILPILVWAM